MDSVHSSQESKRVILTFFLTREKLFLAFIMNRFTQGAVKLILGKLEHPLGTYDFLKLFNVILTDRAPNSETRKYWKTFPVELYIPVSISVIL